MNQKKPNTEQTDDDPSSLNASSTNHQSALSKMTTEEAIEYLNEKYRKRYTMEDPLFVEACDRQEISTPPIEVNYYGRIKRYRNYNNNRR